MYLYIYKHTYTYTYIEYTYDIGPAHQSMAIETLQNKPHWKWT